jgi:hypothetical protein
MRPFRPRPAVRWQGDRRPRRALSRSGSRRRGPVGSAVRVTRAIRRDGARRGRGPVSRDVVRAGAVAGPPGRSLLGCRWPGMRTALASGATPSGSASGSRRVAPSASGRPRWRAGSRTSSAPSMVQCPVVARHLVGEAVADLEQLDRQHAHVAERVRVPARAFGSGLSVGPSRARAPPQIPSVWRFSTRIRATTPSRPSGIDSSRSNGRPRASGPPSARPTSSGCRITACPVVPEPYVLTPRAS